MKQQKLQPIWYYIATWFGAGLSPKAPGTVGTLAALPFAFVIQYFFGNFALYFAASLLFVIGWWASNKFIAQYGGEDPQQIVVDEVAGVWLLLCVMLPTWQSYLVGFIVFRLFDIIKPWPISFADAKIKGGLGVMVDDILAAIYPVFIFLFILVEAQYFKSQNLLQPVMNFLGGSYVK